MDGWIYPSGLAGWGQWGAKIHPTKIAENASNNLKRDLKKQKEFTHIFLTQNIFGHKILLDPKFVGTQKLFECEFFGNKIWDQIILFNTNFIWTLNCLEPRFFGTLKFLTITFL